MNKNIKRIIAITLAIGTYRAVSAITPGTFLDITTKPVYASSYSPSSEELKSLTVKSTNGDTLDLKDGYNGSTVKLNDDKDYYAKLTDDSEGIKINASVKGEGYIVRIFTSDKADATGYQSGDEIPLGKGNTTLYVRTYESLSAYRKAKDDKKDVTICEEEYTVNVKKTTESSYEDNTQDSIYLENIEISKGDITFLKQRTSYDIEVDSSVSEIKITAPPEDSDDRVRIDGSLVNSSDNYRKTVYLDDGKNEIKIKVTDDKDNQRTYTLNVTRGSSSSDNQDEIYLDDLSLNEGNIDFSAEDTSYEVNIDESISKIKITATPEDEEYLVTINGEEVNSGNDYEKNISLSKGENTVKVVIQDEVNDKKRTYTLTINRGEAQAIDETDTTDNQPGWVQTDVGWKYNDENGNPLKKSWLFDKEVGLYCYLDEDGLRVTGWLKDNGKWYLLNAKGAMLTGWQKTDGKWYLLDTNGAMRTGWYKQEVAVEGNNNANTSSDTNSSTNATTTNTDTARTEGWYYLNNDGSMRTGWLLDGGKWYYLNTNGTMQTGWLIYSNSKYYLNSDGSMATGTKTIDGKIYKFTTSGALII
ncbi:MAG: cadherin-like beta sandwich domain-containing protein [Clostridium sp.]|uniref:cadherin-like beta sandwich domain-containing protein n=1 Tax=Clostridium sp. TaxID=1506 RepID=UPI0025BB5B58|nr:cadherin-like beta sandwich domain-containing protein [Clostridium sp.]MCE5221770.1 cadherin-like beta sandwich domain-containing protein [Clostridium sp.]